MKKFELLIINNLGIFSTLCGKLNTPNPQTGITFVLTNEHTVKNNSDPYHWRTRGKIKIRHFGFDTFPEFTNILTYRYYGVSRPSYLLFPAQLLVAGNR